jgi:hypothetical protein
MILPAAKPSHFFALPKTLLTGKEFNLCWGAVPAMKAGAFSLPQPFFGLQTLIKGKEFLFHCCNEAQYRPFSGCCGYSPQRMRCP